MQLDCNCSPFPLDSADASKQAHQKSCPKFPEGDGDADALRSLLRNIKLGTVADEVLKVFPKRNMTQKPKVLGNKYNAEGQDPTLVVKWFYPKFNLTLARGYQDSAFGQVSAYAVQKIEEANNNVRKPGFHNPRPGKSKHSRKGAGS